MIKKVTNLINKIRSDTLLSGSTLVLSASLVSSAMNYVFHVLAGRVLGPADYGILVSLFSLLYIVGVPGTTLATTTTKFASKYKAAEDFDAVTHALVWITKFVLGVGSFLIFVGITFRQQIAGFLKIPAPSVLIFFSIFLALTLLRSAPIGFLRGLLRFKSYAFVSLVDTSLKLLFGIGLAVLGFSVSGIISGMILGIVFTFTTALILLRKNLRFPFQKNSFCWREVLSFAAPTILVILTFNALYNADIVLVKHFFSPQKAGIYSSTVTMGRIIFFGLNSVGLVMFPLVSEKYESGSNYRPVFTKALFLVVFAALCGVVLYATVPGLLVNLLFGNQYIKAVPYLSSFALFMGIFAVVNLFMQFFLSVRDFRFLPVLVAAALLQVGLIWQFHASLHQVIYVNIGVTAAALIGMGVFYMTGSEDNPKAECGMPSAERG